MVWVRYENQKPDDRTQKTEKKIENANIKFQKPKLQTKNQKVPSRYLFVGRDVSWEYLSGGTNRTDLEAEACG